MRGNSGVAHPPETFGNDSGYFKAVEALGPHFSENSPHRVLDPGRPERSKEHYFYLGCHEKEVPAGAMDLAVHGEAVELLDYVPFPRVGLTHEPKKVRNLRAICDQNRSDLYGRRHNHPQRHSSIVTLERAPQLRTTPEMKGAECRESTARFHSA